MEILVNCLLLMVAAVLLVIGFDFFYKNKKTKDKTRYYILFYSITSAAWCLCYGLIGVSSNLEMAAKIRTVGVIAIDSFYLVETFLISNMSGLKRGQKFIPRVIAITLTIIDAAFYTNEQVDNFVRIGNWTTWYANPDLGNVRLMHTVNVLLMMLNLFVVGVLWAKNNKLKRNKRFIFLAFFANFGMMFFAIPDTFLPPYGFPAVPTSGFGAALCTFVIWLGAVKLNSFDIQISNVSTDIYNQINAGIIVMNPNREVVIANPYARSLLPEGDNKNFTLQDVFIMTNVDVEDIYDKAVNTIYSNRFEGKKDGNIYSVRVSVARDNYNEPYCYFCVLTDVTNEINMVKELEIANNAKTAFLTSISHEIRTPINAMLGFNEMIVRQTDDSEIIHYSDSITRAGKMLLAIINDLLDMGQISSGKMKIISAEYRLSKLISDVLAMHQLKAEEKGLAFKIVNDEYIPNRLYGDAVRIQQIINNLASNAIKYTENGAVSVYVDYREKAEEGIDLIIRIEDTGMGIKEEDLPYLYDSFKRFDSVKNRHVEGTGVGLSITHSLVDLMQGTITVDSTYGKGTCFTVIIPQQVIDREPVGKMDNYLSDEKTDRTVYFTAPKANILSVDDNSLNLQVFCGLVKHLKTAVDTATSGTDALEMIKNKHYDLIFIDHMMPQMDGVETLGEIKKDKTHPNQDTPVIVMTANTVRGAKEEYLEAGFTDYVAKPAEVATLEKIIRTYLKPELIQKQQDDEAEKPEEEEEFPRIEGVDWSVAFKTIPDPKLLKELVAAFCSASAEDIAVLKENFENLEEPEALSLYRIKVHSMKNSAILVGAEELSAHAKELEYAARDNDTDCIREKHAAFIAEYKAVSDRLLAFISKGNVEVALTKKKMTNEMLLSNLNMLEEAMKDFDTDALNSMVFAMEDYAFESEAITEKIDQLREAVRNFEQETFFETITAIRGIIQ